MNEKNMTMADRRSRSVNSTKIFVFATSSQKAEKKDEKKAEGIHKNSSLGELAWKRSQPRINSTKDKYYALDKITACQTRILLPPLPCFGEIKL